MSAFVFAHVTGVLACTLLAKSIVLWAPKQRQGLSISTALKRWRQTHLALEYGIQYAPSLIFPLVVWLLDKYSID